MGDAGKAVGWRFNIHPSEARVLIQARLPPGYAALDDEGRCETLADTIADMFDERATLTPEPKEAPHVGARDSDR